MTNRTSRILVFTLAILLIGATGSALASSHGEGPKEEHKAQKAEQQKKVAININTATAKELTKLKGIGSKTAEAIVAYREQHGAFKNASDIQKVKGIGKKTFEKIKEEISVQDH